MSGFSKIALPGRIPVAGSGRNDVTPEKLFSGQLEQAAAQRLVDQVNRPSGLTVSKVKVEIFDLSDPKQVKRYEKLWADLLVKASRGDVVVDHHKDLVQRKDGTSYWMKYVEYVEFGKAKKPESDGKDR